MTIYKRPESVLIVVYTMVGDILLLNRVQPEGFWQSVTGSMHWEETEPLVTARRELQEETGLQGDYLDIIDCETTSQFPIMTKWGRRFAPSVTHNTEHVFRLQLPEQVPITLNPAEHSEYEWLSRSAALDKVSSYTNRDAILQFVPDV